MPFTFGGWGQKYVDGIPNTVQIWQQQSTRGISRWLSHLLQIKVYRHQGWKDQMVWDEGQVWGNSGSIGARVCLPPEEASLLIAWWQLRNVHMAVCTNGWFCQLVWPRLYHKWQLQKVSVQACWWMVSVSVLAALVCAVVWNCLPQQMFHCSVDLIILLPLHSVAQFKAKGGWISTPHKQCENTRWLVQALPHLFLST